MHGVVSGLSTCVCKKVWLCACGSVWEGVCCVCGRVCGVVCVGECVGERFVAHGAHGVIHVSVLECCVLCA